MLTILSRNPLSGTKLQEVFSKLKEIYCINDVSEDRKKYLTETIQKYGYLPYPHYKVLDEFGLSHDKTYIIGVYYNDILVAQGEGRSKKDAEQAAAKRALEFLKVEVV